MLGQHGLWKKLPTHLDQHPSLEGGSERCPKCGHEIEFSAEDSSLGGAAVGFCTNCGCTFENAMLSYRQDDTTREVVVSTNLRRSKTFWQALQNLTGGRPLLGTGDYRPREEIPAASQTIPGITVNVNTGTGQVSTDSQSIGTTDPFASITKRLGLWVVKLGRLPSREEIYDKLKGDHPQLRNPDREDIADAILSDPDLQEEVGENSGLNASEAKMEEKLAAELDAQADNAPAEPGSIGEWIRTYFTWKKIVLVLVGLGLLVGAVIFFASQLVDFSGSTEFIPEEQASAPPVTQPTAVPMAPAEGDVQTYAPQAEEPTPEISGIVDVISQPDGGCKITFSNPRGKEDVMSPLINRFNLTPTNADAVFTHVSSSRYWVASPVQIGTDPLETYLVSTNVTTLVILIDSDQVTQYGITCE